MTLFVNPDRLQADFEALSAIGAFADAEGNRGVDRPALSPAHLEARAWFLDRAAQAGLETRIDAAGNHSAILRAGTGVQSQRDASQLNAPTPALPDEPVDGRARAGSPHASRPTLLLGSHLD